MEQKKKFQKQMQKQKLKKSAKVARIGKSRSGGRGHTDIVWSVRRELDPECAYFPPSAWGTTMKRAKQEEYLFTIRLAFDSAVTTDGSGNFATVYSNSPVQAQNWANYAAVFDAYRVLSFKVKYEPFWTVNCTFAPMASVLDVTDSTALTSYGLAERYSSHRKAEGKRAWSQTYAMDAIERADFVITSSPAANAWIKTYTSGNTASFTMGRMNCEMLVQFRGVGIN